MAVELTRHAVDAAAAVTVLATIAQWLPPVAALFSIAWYAFQFFLVIRNKGVK